MRNVPLQIAWDHDDCAAGGAQRLCPHRGLHSTCLPTAYTVPRADLFLPRSKGLHPHPPPIRTVWRRSGNARRTSALGARQGWQAKRTGAAGGRSGSVM